MKRFRYFFFLNFYGFVISAFLLMHLLLFVFLPSLRSNWYICVLQIVFFLACLSGCVHIFCDYRVRKKIYSYLLRKNCHRISEGSFKEYMQVPCHRMVCREVLYELRHKEMYPLIYRKYYSFFEKDGVRGYRKLYQKDNINSGE